MIIQYRPFVLKILIGYVFSPLPWLYSFALFCGACQKESSQTSNTVSDTVAVNHQPLRDTLTFKVSFDYPEAEKIEYYFATEHRDIDSAIVLIRSAKARFIKEGNREGHIRTLNDLAKAHWYRDESEASLTLLEESLQLCRRYLPEPHPLMANAYHLRGRNQYDQRRINEALQSFQIALAQNRQVYHGEHIHLCDILIDIGKTYCFGRSDYKNAEKYLSEALREHHRAAQKKESNEWDLNYWLSITHKNREDYTSATIYGKRGMDMARKMYGDVGTHTQVSYANLGNIYQDQQDYENAEKYYNKAVQIYVKGKGYRTIRHATYYGNLALVAIELNYLEKSKKYLSTQKEILERLDMQNSLRMAYNHLLYGLASNKSNDYTTALYHFQECLKIRKRKYDAANEKIANAYRNIARTYLYMGNYPVAQEYLHKALWACIDNESQLKNKAGSPPCQSIVHYWEAIETLTTKAQILKSLSFQNDKAITRKQVIDCYKTIDSLVYFSKSGLNNETSQFIMADNYRNLYDDAVDFSFTSWSRTKDEDFISDAFFFMEQSKSQVLLEKILKAKTGLPDSLLEREADIDLDYNYYKKLQEKNKGGANAKVHNENLYRAHLVREELRKYLKENHPQYFKARYEHTNPGLPEVQQYLKAKNTHLIAFHCTDSLLYGLYLGKNKTGLIKEEAHQLLKKDIPRFIQLTKQFSSDLKDYDEFRKLGTAIFKRLFAPIANDHDFPRKIVLIADGVLKELNFGTLLMGSSSQNNNMPNYQTLPYLTKYSSISYINSASVLFENKSNEKLRTTNGKGMIAFSYSPPVGMDMPKEKALLSLKGGSKEIAHFEKQFSGMFLDGKKASELQFKKHAGSYGIVHLAIHGKADRQSNLDTRLIFNTGDSTDDGNLYPYELYNLRLKDTELVVASACETGLGKAHIGEGVLSMARGFTYAGCPTTVMSLWEADDIATSKIMIGFYDGLTDGLPIDKALQQAKIQFINTADELTAHPANWAAFVPTGDMSPIDMPLKKKKGRFYYILVFVLLLMGSLLIFLKRKKVGQYQKH